MKLISATGDVRTATVLLAAEPSLLVPCRRRSGLSPLVRNPHGYSTWPLQRLADYLAEQSGIPVEASTVRVYLKAWDMGTQPNVNVPPQI